MKLCKPTTKMKNEYLEFLIEWEDINDAVIPYSAIILNQTYEEWLNILGLMENIETYPVNLVDAYTFVLIEDNDRINGTIHIGHRLNGHLFNFGGHIRYGIRPSVRQKGYVIKMLSMALAIVKGMGINKALITCDKVNLGSAKTIVNNGGILENEVLEDNKIIQRYWISMD